MSFEMICASVQGASHIRKNIPCEDYGVKFENEYCRIFVLGDGHGDTNCPRSSIGSEYVCKIAVECLSEFEKNIRECHWTEELFDTKGAEKLVRQLITSIIGRWAENVNDEYSSHPLSEKELEGLDKEYAQKYKSGQRIGHIYGTTLMAGLQTDRYLLLIHQGDGRCVVFDKNGDASQPVPWDEKCMANITTSVCDTDAVSRCRYKVIDLSDSPVIACFLGSDGVEDSFSSFDSMYSFYRMLIEHICENGIDGTEKFLMEYLPEFSAKGSADDTTLCGIVDIDAAKQKLEKLSLDSEIVSLNDTIKNADERIPQMEGKLNYLKSQCNKNRTKDNSANAKKQTMDDGRAELRKLGQRLSELENKYQEAQKKYRSIERELSEVRAAYYRFSGYEKGQNVSIWQSRQTDLVRQLSKKSGEIAYIKSLIDNINEEKKLIKSRAFDKVIEINEGRTEAEKEYEEYYKKYTEVIESRNAAAKRLSEIGKTNKKQ